MNKIKSIFLAAVMVLVTGAWAQTDKTVTTADGLDRTYKLYIPANPKGIIVALHGLGGTSDFFFNNYPITDIADQMNYIIIAPQALDEQDPSVVTTIDKVASMGGVPIPTNGLWGCGMKITIPALVAMVLQVSSNTELNATINDEEFIHQIIGQTLTDYNLPTNNIFMFGISMGGLMAYQYAEKYPEDLSGLISIASSRGLAIDGSSSVPLPILDFHSDHDEILPYSGSLPVTANGMTVNVSMAQAKNAVIDYWVSRNGANSSPDVEDVTYYQSNNDITVTKYTYAQTEGNEVIHYKATSPTAGIPNHAYLFSEANGDCMDYAEEIAKFITAHSVTADITGPTPIPQIATGNLLTQTQNGINLAAKTNATIAVYNLNGKLISQQTYFAGNHSISLSHLPKGFYIVKASFGSEKQILRIAVR